MMNLLRVPATQGRRIAIGDIHGCFETFRWLVEQEIKINSNDQLFILGDFVSRGAKSGALLDYFMELQKQAFSLYLLKGNHEEKLLMAYDCGFDFFEHYLQTYNLLDLLEGNLYDYLALCANSEQCIYLENNIYLNHKGLDDVFNQYISNQKNANFRLIHGHLTRSLSDIRNNINNKEKILTLDSGCIYTEIEGLGYLSALDIDSGDIWSVKNMEKALVERGAD